MMNKPVFQTITIILALMLGACSDNLSSDAASALQPVWLLSADANTGQVQVKGLVTDTRSGADYSAELRQLGIAGIVFPDVEEPESATDLHGPGIRLSGGDVMSAQSETTTHQLYRREQALIYQARFALQPERPNYILRLDYVNSRFESSVIAVRLFNVTGFFSDALTPVSHDALINLSWTTDEAVISETHTYLQRIVATSQNCQINNSAPTTHVIELMPDVSSVSIPVREVLPSLFSDDAVALPDACTFVLQLVALSIPVMAEAPDGMEPIVDAPLVPFVVMASRSEKLAVQLGNTNGNSL